MIPKDANVEGAILTMTVASTTGTASTVQDYAVTKAWSTPTWANASAGLPWSSAGGDYNPATSGPYSYPGYSNAQASGAYRDDITQLASNWVSGVTANDGVLIKLKSETGNYVVTFDGPAATGVSAPILQITWAQHTAAFTSGGTLTRKLTDRLALSVSPTGAEEAQGSLLSLPGVGPALSLGYAIDEGAGGTSTRTSTTFDAISLALGSFGPNSLIYSAANGEQYAFVQSSALTYTPAPTLNAVMTVDSGHTTWTLRFNNTGITNTYQNVGSNDHSLIKTQDSSGNAITYTYASCIGTGEKLTSITDTQGRVVNFGFDATGSTCLPSTIADTSAARTVSLGWDPATYDQLNQVTDAAGKTTMFGYDTNGSLKQVTDPDGHITAITSSSPMPGVNAVSSVTFGSGSATPSTYGWTYTSGSPNNTTVLTDAKSGQTTYTWTANNDQVLDVKDPLGHHQSSTWNPTNAPASRTDGLSQVTNYTYDTLNNPKTTTAPRSAGSTTAAVSTMNYPTPVGSLADYQASNSKDAQGNTTSYSYNSNFLLSATTQATGGGTITYKRQGDPGVTSCSAKAGQVCQMIDAKGNINSYGYDGYGNLTTVTPPAPLGVVTYSYDSIGRRTASTDGAGHVLHYEYDTLDRLTRTSMSATTCPAASCTAYTYNPEGWLTQRVDPSGTTSYTYDAQGRPTAKNTPTGNTSSTYDGNGNLIGYTDVGGTTTYGYDAANEVTKVAEPTGSCPATPTFPNSTLCTGFGYDNNGQRNSIKYPNGQTITLGYNNAGQQTSVVAKNGSGTTLASRTYSYVLAGADGAVRRTVTDQAGVTTTYTYDGLNRVKTATPSTGTAESWNYDADGNITSATRGATSYFGYNAADEMCWSATTTGTGCATPTGGTSYAFDGTGNLTTQAGSTIASYNTFNQQTSTTTGGSTTYGYSDLNNTERTAVTTSSGTINYVYGILGLTRQTGATSLSFTRDPNGNLLSMRTASNAHYYYTLDALGSVILMTDSSGAAAASYTYSTYGVQLTATGTVANSNPYRYATGYLDSASGLLKLGARYYNPATGRFTQPDPNGQNTNPYLYAGDGPSNAADPTGKRCDGSIGNAGILTACVSDNAGSNYLTLDYQAYIPFDSTDFYCTVDTYSYDGGSNEYGVQFSAGDGTGIAVFSGLKGAGPGTISVSCDADSLFFGYETQTQPIDLAHDFGY